MPNEISIEELREENAKLRAALHAREHCRICGEDTATHHVTYWQALRQPICKIHTSEERKAFKMREAYECQIIDADCNDCKHFKRGKPNLYESDQIDPRTGKPHVVNLQSWSGRCLKFDRPTIAYPNFASGHECFEHRKAEEYQNEV